MPNCYYLFIPLQSLSKGVITLAKKRNGWRVKCDKGLGYDNDAVDDDRISHSFDVGALP